VLEKHQRKKRKVGTKKEKRKPRNADLVRKEELPKNQGNDKESRQFVGVCCIDISLNKNWCSCESFC
jgi:hypothetical protein